MRNNESIHRGLSNATALLIVQGFWPNFIKNDDERILHFYNFF